MNTININILASTDFFKDKHINIIREKLYNVPDGQFQSFLSIKHKSPTIAFILAFFLGYLGIDRMYIGDIAFGVLVCFISIICVFSNLAMIPFIWWLINLFLIRGATKNNNFKWFIEVIG